MSNPYDLAKQAFSKALIEQADSTPGLCFDIDSVELRRVLERASAGLADKAAVLEVLRNFRIAVTEGLLFVTASDMEMTVLAATSDFTSVREGEVLVPGKRLLAVAREAAGDLRVEVTGGRVDVISGHTKTELSVVRGVSYPSLPDVKKPDGVVNRQEFLSSISMVKVAMSTEPARASMRMVDVKGGLVRATDGARYVHKNVEGLPDLSLPYRAVERLVKLLRLYDVPTLEVSVEASTVLLRAGNDFIIVTRPAATFPNADAEIERARVGNKQALVVSKEALLSAIRRVRAAVDSDRTVVSFIMPKGQLVSVESSDQFGNYAKEELEQVTWNHPTRVVKLNADFLHEAVSHGEATCTLLLRKDESKSRPSPVVIRSDALGYLYVLNQMVG